MIGKNIILVLCLKEPFERYMFKLSTWIRISLPNMDPDPEDCRILVQIRILITACYYNICLSLLWPIYLMEYMYLCVGYYRCECIVVAAKAAIPPTTNCSIVRHNPADDDDDVFNAYETICWEMTGAISRQSLIWELIIKYLYWMVIKTHLVWLLSHVIYVFSAFYTINVTMIKNDIIIRY